MPDIKNFLYCKSVNMVGEDTNIIGILNSIELGSIPESFSFSIFFTVSNLLIGKHTLSVNLYDPSNNLITDTNVGEIMIEQDLGENKILYVVAELKNVLFKKEGIYFSEVVIDEEKIGEYMIKVKGKGE